ncbi:MAG: DUF3379 domain-containing protein [Thermoanaerobaculia bacterium]|nr:DUF3379 domain-containing protein [Thermoanaerobaculia bacterium]
MVDSQTLRDELAAAIADGGLPEDSDRPSLDELLAYCSDELDPASADRVQDHLVSSRSSLEQVLELDAFLNPETPTSGSTDLRTVRAWRDLRSRIPRRSPWRALAVAASVLFAAGLSWLVLSQQRIIEQQREELASLESAQPDAPILDLFPRGSVRSLDPIDPAVFPESAGFAILVLNLPDAAPFDRFAAELVSSTGEVLWSGPLRPSAYGTFRLGVQSTWLRSGASEVRLYGVEGEQDRHLLETFPLERGPSRDGEPSPR